MLRSFYSDLVKKTLGMTFEKKKKFYSIFNFIDKRENLNSNKSWMLFKCFINVHLKLNGKRQDSFE